MMKTITKKILSKVSPSYKMYVTLNSRLLEINNKINYLCRDSDFKKSLHSGERQVSENIDGIRADHVGRYKFAQNLISDNSKVLDLACGVGYGSHILSENSTIDVTGIDISEDAISYATKHYQNSNIKFLCMDATNLSTDERFDYVVSFETIEHIEDDSRFLLLLSRLLKPGGKLICSVPNQEKLPYTIGRFPFHYRHYTISQITDLLTESSLGEVKIYTQQNDAKAKILENEDGHFIIATANKV